VSLDEVHEGAVFLAGMLASLAQRGWKMRHQTFPFQAVYTAGPRLLGLLAQGGGISPTHSLNHPTLHSLT
jgi:hypothetical protein